MPSTKYIVVTGTDTGVGKTVVATGLSRSLARRGARVIAIKPVESGCGDANAGVEDGAALATATGQNSPRAAIVRLRAPLAPALAADREGLRMDLGELVDEIRRLGRDSDVAVVEGAGGLMAPITWEGNIRVVVRMLGADVLVVATDRLGCINHVLLTLEALRDDKVLGVVLSAPATSDESTGTNAGALVAAGAHVTQILQLPRITDINRSADVFSELAGLILTR